MRDGHALVGRTVRLKFTESDATPDLHEMGEVKARITAVSLEGSPPSEKVKAEVEAPAAMKGLEVALAARYEGEALDLALGGAWITVEAFFTEKGGRAVAGGLGTLTFAAH